jgi:hypothetical protein
MGVTIYESTTRARLFTGQHRDEVFRNIINSEIDVSKLADESTELYDFVKRLLEKKYKRRLGYLSANDVMSHAYFHGIKWDTLSKDEAEYVPPSRVYKSLSEMEILQNRNQFYGDEDPTNSTSQVDTTKNQKLAASIESWKRKFGITASNVSKSFFNEDHTSNSNEENLSSSINSNSGSGASAGAFSK